MYGTVYFKWQKRFGRVKNTLEKQPAESKKCLFQNSNQKFLKTNSYHVQNNNYETVFGNYEKTTTNIL